MTTVEGTGPGPASTPSPRPHPQGREAAAPVGGRRDITRATTEAAGGGDARPGGNQSSRSDYTSSGHGGGGDPPPTTTTTPADGGRVAAAAGLPAARADGAGTVGLDGVDLGSGPTPSSSALGPRRARPGAMGPAAGARQLDGGADRGHGVLLDARLGGGLARQPGNAHSYAHIPQMEADPPHVQAAAGRVSLDCARPAARHCPA